MLVISRKKGESLFVGSAEIKVVQCSDGRVRLSIKAPKDVKVVRAELLQRGPVVQGSGFFGGGGGGGGVTGEAVGGGGSSGFGFLGYVVGEPIIGPAVIVAPPEKPEAAETVPAPEAASSEGGAK